MAIAKKKKKFFNVEIPIINKTTQLQAFEIEELDGRYIKYDLTRSLRGKSVILQAIVKVKNQEANATPNKITLLQSNIKKMVRKGTNYVEDSFSTETADTRVRIKPFLVTRRKVSRAVRKALRNKVKEELIEYLKTKPVEEIFDKILKNTLQRTLSLKLKKIYPLSTCEIKVLRVEKRLEKTTQTKKEKTEEKKEEIQTKKETTSKKE